MLRLTPQEPKRHLLRAEPCGLPCCRVTFLLFGPCSIERGLHGLSSVDTFERSWSVTAQVNGEPGLLYQRIESFERSCWKKQKHRHEQGIHDVLGHRGSTRQPRGCIRRAGSTRYNRTHFDNAGSNSEKAFRVAH